jgi:hypothetical protein
LLDVQHVLIRKHSGEMLGAPTLIYGYPSRLGGGGHITGLRLGSATLSPPGLTIACAGGAAAFWPRVVNGRRRRRWMHPPMHGGAAQEKRHPAGDRSLGERQPISGRIPVQLLHRAQLWHSAY